MSDEVATAKEGMAVFRCNDLSYTDSDVIHAALFRGEVQPVWNEMLRRLEAENQAGDADVDDEIFDSAVEQFRYDHDLITAEETEQWLEARGLDLDDLGAFFSRRYWGNQPETHVQPPSLDYPTESPEMKALLRTELWLSDEFDRMAARLAWRVSAAKVHTGDDVDLALGRAAFLERTGITEEDLPAWLGSLGRDEEWLREMIRIETIYDLKCAAIFTPQARQREMAGLRLGLTRLNAEMLELDSEDAAREAALCVQMDGLTMEEVARENGYPYRRFDILVEDIAPEIQQKFLSVPVGSVLDPLSRGDGFQLVRILEKVEPGADDTEVQRRIDKRIQDQHFGKLMADHIQWKGPMAGRQS